MTVELTQATENYWRISLIYHQGIGSSLNVSQAIRLSGEAAFSVGPHRRIRYKLLHLRDRIIKGRSKSKTKKPKPAGTISQLPLRKVTP